MAVATRPDVDIVEDIEDLMMHYPPAAHDRHRIHVSAEDGVVTLSGYTKAPVTRSYLLEHIKNVSGVKAVQAKAFYDDESLRLSIGRIVPTGVQVMVEYGAAILAGKLPAGVNEAQVETKVGAVPGVHKVVLAFS
jgi:osmotically-inducible protein OsmY